MMDRQETGEVLHLPIGHTLTNTEAVATIEGPLHMDVSLLLRHVEPTTLHHPVMVTEENRVHLHHRAAIPHKLRLLGMMFQGTKRQEIH